MGTFGDGKDFSVPLRYRAIPEYKVRSFLSVSDFVQGLALVHWYIDGTDVTLAYIDYLLFPEIRNVDSFSKLDLHCTRTISDSAEIILSVLNVLDEDAPLAPTDHGIDATGANPLGRMFEITFSYRLSD